jgi:hypothetical protein
MTSKAALARRARLLNEVPARYEPVERIGVSHRYQASPDNRTDEVGFRCAKDAPG